MEVILSCILIKNILLHDIMEQKIHNGAKDEDQEDIVRKQLDDSSRNKDNKE